MYKCKIVLHVHGVVNCAHCTHIEHICVHVHHIPHTEPTLTLENLTSLLGIKDMDSVAIWLHIPDSKQWEMEQQYRSVPQRKQAYSEYWLTHHPSPSWLVVADALYMWEEHEALEVLQKMYLKG